MNIHYVPTFHMSHLALPYDQSRLRGSTVGGQLLQSTQYQVLLIDEKKND